MIATGLVAVRLLLVAGLLLLLAPLHLLLDAGRVPPGPVARLFLKGASALLGLRWSLDGEAAARPVLLVANHVGWADILVMGAALDASFVAKREVRSWPLLGWLAQRHGTLFVDRARRRDAGRQGDKLRERLAGGGSTVLFPEGTTGDGIVVRPFKPALLAAVEGSDTLVQPVTLAWIAGRDRVAWVDDTPFGAHAARLLRGGGAEVRILLHPPLRASDFPSRRALADRCREVVAAGLDGDAQACHKAAG